MHWPWQSPKISQASLDYIEDLYLHHWFGHPSELRPILEDLHRSPPIPETQYRRLLLAGEELYRRAITDTQRWNMYTERQERREERRAIKEREAQRFRGTPSPAPPPPIPTIEDLRRDPVKFFMMQHDHAVYQTALVKPQLHESDFTLGNERLNETDYSIRAFPPTEEVVRRVYLEGSSIDETVEPYVFGF